MKKNGIAILVIFSFILVALSSSLSLPVTLDEVDKEIASEDEGEVKRAVSGNDWWHIGSDISTPEVDITYTIEKQEDYYYGNQYRDIATQRLRFRYQDGTESNIGFKFMYILPTGSISGEDIDWDNRIDSNMILEAEAPNEDGYNVGFSREFWGFRVLNGSASDFYTTNVTDVAPYYHYEPHGLGPIFNYTIANIYVSGGTFNISDINLNTVDYTYEGDDYKESIATFNISTNAFIGTSTDNDSIDCDFSFTFKHNVTNTMYKYGMNLSWIGSESFSSSPSISSNDPYMLVGADTFGINYEPVGYKKSFTTNTYNDTVYYYNGADFLAKQQLSLKFNISGGGWGLQTNRETVRHYYPDAVYESTVGVWSRIFEIYEGFNYGLSNGFSFDPTVIVPCYIQPTNTDDDDEDKKSNEPPAIPGPDAYIICIMTALSIASIGFFLKKKGKLVL